MSTYLANLASRALPPSSSNPSRLLRPFVPTIFASSAVESKRCGALDASPSGRRALYGEIATAGDICSRLQRGAGSHPRLKSPAGNPIAAPVRSQGSAAEARIARPSVRRDPDLVAEEPVRPLAAGAEEFGRSGLWNELQEQRHDPPRATTINPYFRKCRRGPRLIEKESSLQGELFLQTS